MSTATDILEALLTETDDDSGPSSYSVEDALNDQSDFHVESLISPSTTTTNAGQTQPIDSSHATASNGTSPIVHAPSSSDTRVISSPSMVSTSATAVDSATKDATGVHKEPKLSSPGLAEALRETVDLELTPSANVNIDRLVKSIITDKSEGVKDAQLMQKVKDYERNVMDVEDSKRLLKTLEERRRRKELNSSILQIVKLDKIAAQVTSAQFKKTSGSPTCIAASAKLLAIGTTHGVTLIFDHFQTLKMVVGTTDGVEYGRVYSAAFSSDSEWLIVGHHIGQVVIWDLTGAKPIKTLTNDAPLGLDSRSGVPIIFVDFLEKKTRFIVLSLDGVLNVHTLTRVFLVTMVDTNYVLTGQSGSGSVIAVSPLQPGLGKAHPVDIHNLIACATFKRIVIFPASDKTSVIYHMKRPDGIREGALPYMAWRELVSTSSKNPGHTKLLDPVLAVAWGTTITLTQIIQSLTDSSGLPVDPTEVASLVFRRVAVFHTDTEITGIHWLGTGVLVYANTADELRVLDPFSVEEIEIDSIKHMELAYHTKFAGTRAAMPGTPAFAAAQATGSSSAPRTSSTTRGPFPDSPVKPLGPSPSQSSRPSKAMPIPKAILEEERERTATKGPAVTNRDQTLTQSFHASMCTFRGQLFLIGVKSPYVVTVLGWSERIGSMVEKGRWLDALALSLDFYHGRAKAVKGLPRDPAKASAKIGARIEQLLYDYAKVNLAIPVPKDPTHFDMVATGRRKTGLLLEKLEPFILGDKLKSLPPEVIQQIVKHYTSQPQLIPKLEQILLHVELGLLDFHSVVNLCIKHHLSTALFHLYIDGLQDYLTPMDHLMKVLVKDLDLSNQFTTPEMRELKRTIGYKILLYLSFIFKGKSFPSETKLPARKVDDLRELIFEYLMVPKLGGDLAGERFPRLRVLLATDSHELLGVLRIALDSMSSPKRLIQITDVLVSLMVDLSQGAGKQHSLFWSDKPNPSWPFVPSQVAELYYFIAHYYSSGTLDISDDLLQRITGYTILSNDSLPDKREKLLLEVLRSCPEEKLEYQKLALLAESAKFYKVCDFFFTHRRDYGAVIRCHILDPEYRKSIFSFVRTLMTSTDPSNPKAVAKRPSSSSPTTPSTNDPRFVAYMLTDKEKEDVKRACIEKITDLIRIDNDRTAQLVINVLQCDQTQLMSILNPYPEIQLLYLKACLKYSLAEQSVTSAAFPAGISGTPTKRGKKLTNNASQSDASQPQHTRKTAQMDLVAGEKLLELLCRFEPQVVVGWLKENESVYRLDAAIEITKHFKLWPAYVALQETAGDMTEVLRILLEPVSEALNALYEKTKNTTLQPPFGVSPGVLPSQTEEEEVQDVVDISISFLKRNHKRMESNESQQMWFRILDQVMQPLGEVEYRLTGGRRTSTSTSTSSSSTTPNTSSQSSSTATTPSPSLANSRFQGRSTNDLELLKYHLNKLISRILDSMIGYVDLQSILEKILNDRVDSKVSDFRDIFVRLLENYTHEKSILGAAVEVLRYDTHQQFEKLVRRKQRGVPGRLVSVENTSSIPQAEDGAQQPSDPNATLSEEISRLQILRDLDAGMVKKTRRSLEPNSIRRDTLASMRNIQLQPTVPGAMSSYSLFHSVINLDDSKK